MAETFDADFEAEVLAQCLVDAKYLRGAYGVLEARSFAVKEHAWVWRVIKETWASNAEVATTAILRSRATLDFPDEEQRRPHLEILVKLYRRPRTAPRTSLDELIRFARIGQMQIAVEGSLKAQEQGHWDEADEHLVNYVHKKLRKNDYKVSKWIEEWDERQAERKKRREHPEMFRSIPTGFRRLDRKIYGVQEGELCGIMATTSRGKSVFAVNIGFNALLRGFSVIHFSTEMSHVKVAQRYDSRFSHFEYRKFKRFDFTPKELERLAQVVAKNRRKFLGRLRIVSTPLRSCDIDMIKRAVDELRQDMPSVDMVIVDSGDHLQQHGRVEKQYQAEGANYWDLKDLAETMEVPIWVTLQAKQEFETKTASTRAAAGSYDKSRICDLMLSINEPGGAKPSGATAIFSDVEDESIPSQTPNAETKKTALELYVAKCRDDESRFFIPVETDLARMLIKEIEGTDETEPAEETDETA